MKEIFIVFMILVGIAGASLEDGDLSGIDPIVFTGADFAKDGVSGGAESGLTSSQEAFLKDGTVTPPQCDADGKLVTTA